MRKHADSILDRPMDLRKHALACINDLRHLPIKQMQRKFRHGVNESLPPHAC